MTKPAHPDKVKGLIKGDGGRQERLAAELRANLKRRKARGRAVEAAAVERPAGADGKPGKPPGSTDRET